MRTLYLHIGASKTGTSALQVAFARNAKALRGRGLHYPGKNQDAMDGKITSGNGLLRSISTPRWR